MRVEAIMEAGREKAARSMPHTPLLAEHAAALYAYTEEASEQLYTRLNYVIRTPNTDSELFRYAGYIKHVQTALSSLPTHLSRFHGKVYRGINRRVKPENYARDERVTWQAFSSSTKNSSIALNFVDKQGSKLRGSLFIIESNKGKLISSFSAYEAEDEVLFDANSQFQVLEQATSEEEKRAMLDELSNYDTSELDVYSLQQLF